MVDIGYPLRVMALLWRSKGKERPKNVFCDTIVKGRCWPIDLDTLGHMNNSRYLRECDFGRIGLLIETGLWNVFLKRQKSGMKGCNILVSAIQAQYRQSVQLGDRFKIVSRINGWDDKAFHLEQSMFLHKNDQIAFLLLVRLALTPRSLTPQMLIDDLQLGNISSPQLSPPMKSFQENYKLNFNQIKSKI